MAENEIAEGVSYTQLRDEYNQRVDELNALVEKRDLLAAEKDVEQDRLDTADAELNAKVAQVDDAKEKLFSKEARDRVRAQFQPIPTGNDRIALREPDMYTKDSRHSFFRDAYAAQISHDPAAADRIEKHQRLEIEKRVVASSLFTGGLIPPQYLRDLYAKASRNGRIFLDQINNQTLPDEGMSLVVPRITTSTAAGFQTENSAATTQDPVETDLSVGVKTAAAYLPVSRQSIERGAYTDEILFEDMVARYWAQLDSSALNGGGGTAFSGLIGTSGIKTSAASTITAAGVYPKIADVIQQISSDMGGIGYLPDKIFMHPRRWAFFAASLDSQNRPLITPTPVAVNTMGQDAGGPGGTAGGFGFTGQSLQGLPVYLDPNIPTNLGTNTNEDRIIVVCSPVVHLWERAGDPVTVSFEQQAGTSLQVQLVVFGYAAFTAGRYPSASGMVTGLTPPSF